MLLVFDIDDTLVDTSGSLVPILLKRVVDTLEIRGITFPDKEKAYAMLRRIDSSSLSSGDAICEFVELHGGTHKDIEVALNVMYEPDPYPERIDPIEGALTLLPELAKDHSLSLVSRGKEVVQKEKLSRAGFDHNMFDEIAIGLKNKHGYYQQILSQHGISPERMLVIGDRIEMDLSPAKRLGVRTVHFRSGRGLGYTGSKMDVDYTIVGLEELKEIIEICNE